VRVTYQPPPHPQPGYPQYAPYQQAYRPLPPQPLSPGGQPLADFGSRLLAYLLDGVIVGGAAMVVALPVFFIVFFSMIDTAAQPPEAGAFIARIVLLELGLLVVLLVGHYFYYVELIYRSGQTIGKRVAKVRVVPIDPSVRMTRGIAAKRFLVQVVAGTIIPFFSYLDGFWQLWDKPYLQTLHDKFAQTVVVKVSP
jgi:uncharacterized RDD family membrane protein YckC